MKVEYSTNLISSVGLFCCQCWNQVLIQPNASGCLPGHYTIHLVNMFKENLDITYLLKIASGKSKSFDFLQYFPLTTAVTVQHGSNYFRFLFQNKGSQRKYTWEFSLRRVRVQTLQSVELCDLSSSSKSFGLPLGFACIIIFDLCMLTSTGLDQN